MINPIKQKIITVANFRLTNILLLALIMAFAISYIYFANVTVRKITLLEKKENELQNLSVKVSELESKKLSFQNEINIEKAKSLGLVEVKEQTFIVNKSKEALLSLKID